MSQTPQSTNTPTPAGPPMGKTQKVITTALWSVLFLVVIIVLVGKLIPAVSSPTNARPDLTVKFASPHFTLIDQENRPFSSNDLRGKTFICDFIFTTCGSACPIMTAKLSQLQKQTPAEVQLVSFTVNPEHDTPAALKEYANANGADLARWHFLTGTPAQMARTAGESGFAVASEREPLHHFEKFLLVDGDGNIRGMYDSKDEKALKDLVIDAKWLTERKH